MDRKIVLVTGASSGIGYEFAKQIAEKGYYVLALARRMDKLTSLQSEIGKQSLSIFECDVSKEKDIRRVCREISAQNLIPNLFFLNAGMGESDALYSLDTEIHRRTFDVNYFGVVSFVEYFLPLVQQRETKFVGVSSILDYFATPGGSAYCASKSALKACFDGLRRQYAQTSISFVSVLPGPVATDMLKTPKPVPFTWTAQKAASYIIERVFWGKKIIRFSFFWRCFFRFLSVLPDKLALKILGF